MRTNEEQIEYILSRRDEKLREQKIKEKKRAKILSFASAAACFLLVGAIGVGIAFAKPDLSIIGAKKSLADSYSDPDEEKREIVSGYDVDTDNIERDTSKNISGGEQYSSSGSYDRKVKPGRKDEKQSYAEIPENSMMNSPIPAILVIVAAASAIAAAICAVVFGKKAKKK